MVTEGGALRSENVGMSNRKSGEIPDHRKSKVSLATAIGQGLGGPKLNAERYLAMDNRLIFRSYHCFLLE